MLNRTVIPSLFLSSLFLTNLLGADEISQTSPCCPSICEEIPSPMHVTVRHIEKEGIGYKEGYTTLEGFSALNYDEWIPFVDLRGHVFNNGKFDTNVGLGTRYLMGCRSYGINAFYDW